MTKITKEMKISGQRVREFCIRNELYTIASCAEYEKMLNYVYDHTDYDDYTLYHIAKDIKAHSRIEYDTESLMFNIFRECVYVFFNIEEVD